MLALSLLVAGIGAAFLEAVVAAWMIESIPKDN